MRLLVIAVVLTSLIPCTSYSESADDAEHVIARMINSATLEGHDSKIIGPMGDAAAVVLTKVLAGKELRGQDIDGGLWILGQAFGDPSMVKNVPDRRPRSTFLLLRYFSISTNDPDLKKRIEEARKYVEDRYSRTVQQSPSDGR
jgi:hypothetical protein